MNKILLAGLTLLCGLGSIVLVKKYAQRKPADHSVLIVGTSARFHPFEFIDQGKLVGFDIDLMQAIGAKLHKRIEFKDIEFEALLLEAQSGRIHVIAAGMTLTPERAEKLNFSQNYILDDPLVVVRLAVNHITSIDDLVGKEVVVNDGYTAEQYMIQHAPSVPLKRLPTVADAFLDLVNNKSFAYVSALTPVTSFLKAYGTDKFSLFKLGASDGAALALSKHYPELLPQIKAALTELDHEGVIAKLKQKWKVG